jgi:Fe-S cluster assembly protein SufD
MMNTIEYFKEQFERLDKNSGLDAIRRKGFDAFSKFDIPGSKHEEWKYTRIGTLFNKDYQFPVNGSSLTTAGLDAVRLPGHEQANQLVFVNGHYAKAFSSIQSPGLVVLPLEEAATNKYKDIVAEHLGHSSLYQQDGINALNMAFMKGGIFIHVEKSRAPQPVYIYHIADAGATGVFAQPRSLIYVSEQAQVQFVETFTSLGAQASLTNQVCEVIVEKDAVVEYYKIQNDRSQASQVSTTHIRQIGKSYTHAVTISLDGGLVRNNINVVLEAEHSEAHLYGLYFQLGQSHIDNHTLVDNVTPHCFSNELYKGIMSGSSTGVFNGKIFVRQQAQKTNAYQSNKNVLLSADATVNTKPQLEIFADDVKCSHGCTIGRLDEEGMFYLQSRGIPEKAAKALLLQGFAADIIEKIKPAPIRSYVDQLISQRLEMI